MNQTAEVFVNGKPAGEHTGGYTAFNIDLTLFLEASGEQYIAVKADNSHQDDVPPCPPISLSSAVYTGRYI